LGEPERVEHRECGFNLAEPRGDFTIELLDINPGATNPSGAPGGYPTTWTQFTFTISGLSATTDGRFGFRFYLPNNNTDGTIVGIDTFSFADPTVFTRTVSGNWTDTTGWRPNGVPNGTDNIANLVLPASGTLTVNLTGATFTVNQLNVTGAGLGAWNVSNGTLIFDGTTPAFADQSTATGISATIGANVQLNANTTFNIVNLSAVTEVTGAISGTGQLIKTGSGTLTLTGTNTYSGGTLISAGTLQIGDGVTNGSITGDVTDSGTLAFDPSGSVTFGGGVSGTGNLVKLGTGTEILTGTNTYSGGTTISAGTLQIGNGSTTGSITGAVTDNGTLAFDRSDSLTFGGAISGTGGLVQLGSGILILTGTNTYSGGTTISAGTLQIGDGTTSGSITGNVSDSATLAFDPNGAGTFGGAISSTGKLLKLGTGTEILTGTNIYSGGTTISAGTLRIGGGGTTGSITGVIVDNGTLAFDRSDSITFGGAISGTGNLVKLGAGTVILTGTNSYSGGTIIVAGTLQIGMV
jgi:autotransporter-associated beta strand protein